MTDAIPHKTTNTIKNSYRLWISNPKKNGFEALIWFWFSKASCSVVGVIVLSKTPCKSIPNSLALLNLSPVAGKIEPKVPDNA